MAQNLPAHGGSCLSFKMILMEKQESRQLSFELAAAIFALGIATFAVDRTVTLGLKGTSHSCLQSEQTAL